MNDNRPTTYKGKPAEYRGEISDRESFAGKEEGIYYMISTGSFYCYYDGDGSLDSRFIPNPHNPEVANMKPCWYSEMKENEKMKVGDHPPDCKWHKDWHACDCGAFDK